MAFRILGADARGTKLIMVLSNRKGVERAVEKATKKAATLLAGEVRKGILSGSPGGKSFAPLKASTLRRKAGRTKPLIFHGDLLGSVRGHKIKRGEYLVGLHRRARSKDGKRMPNVARIHEEGRPKVGIPARPFLGPTLEKHGGIYMDELNKEMASIFAGAL